MKHFLMAIGVLFAGSAWGMDSSSMSLNRVQKAIKIKNYIKFQKSRVAIFSHPLKVSGETVDQETIKNTLFSYVNQLISQPESDAQEAEYVRALEVSTALATLKYLRKYNMSDDAGLADLETFITTNIFKDAESRAQED